MGQVIKEKAQQAVQSTHDTVKPYLDAAADKTGECHNDFMKTGQCSHCS